jgi:MscS family membrane protein
MLFSDPILSHIAAGVLIIAGSVVVGKLLRVVVASVVRRFTRRAKTTLDEHILSDIEGKIVPLTIVAGVSLGIREVRKGLTAENVTHHQILDYLSTALFVLFILLLFHLLSRLFKSTIEWYADTVSLKNKSNIAPTVVPFTTKLVNIVLFFIVAITLLDHLGVNIGGLLVSLGVGSLAIALAAQETIANMIAWFVILVDQPVRIGDRIRLPSGEEGEVFQIGLRSTRILNLDNNLVVVPNGELVKNRIINLSAPDLSTSVIVDVNVAYGTDVEAARTLALSLVSGRADILRQPPPRVFLTNLGDLAMQLRLAARTPDVSRKFLIETDLREELYNAFRSAKIEIPQIHRVIGVKEPHETETPQKK